MGGGDLNLKKSWHPQLLSNQRRVYESEQRALEERKKTQQRVQELKEERAQEELQKQIEQAGGTKRIDRVEFLYQGPTDGALGTTEELEGFLLGKRRIDNILTKNDNKQVESTAAEANFMALGNANSARDTAQKIREDPLLAIKRREQAAYESMMNDPIKRRQLLASMGIEDAKKESRDKTKHRRHREDRENGRDRRHKRRRSEDRDQSRSRDRNGANSERKHRSRRDDSRDRRSRRDRHDGHDENHRREDSRSRHRSRSRSPRRSQAHEASRRQRSRSPLKHGDRSEDRHPRPSRDGRAVRDGSEPRRQRSSGESHDDRRDSSRREPERNQGRYDRNSRSDWTRHNNKHKSHGGARSGDDKAADEERARKLAAMQEAASELDQDRQRRLAKIEARERDEREADSQARMQDNRQGGGRAFVNGLHRKAGEMSLSDRIGRSKRGLQKDEE
ncbi:hypothetical protein GGTG_12095 [Gaeumannomyces tritici R3-111a-1]|uniref:CBF1-interacting co-repressor CIR N-terminal domain-containing protein n=1 Tax=Gaeumannomyces tritici (strain R3-111a-1) TaxID=644352 RepID=J3PF16_GAET3|nr:hypothetical protein GGTG_12095 [Gaeumannomyces tritici R3-111a-1]EJT71074.1 hypothetical protein GGTG_12095 [Gaeumannomyces tritici R3-111a-1]